MATRDLRSLFLAQSALNIQTITTGTVSGNIIDAQGYESLTFDIFCGTTITNGTFVPNILASNDSGMAGAVSLTSDYTIGSYADVTFTTADSNAHKTIGCIGKYRYFQLQIVASAAAAGGTFGAAVVKGDAHTNPIPWNG
jgi:hypothetical protein